MIDRVVGDAVVVAHFLFIAFVVGGGALLLTWPRIAWFHLPGRPDTACADADRRDRYRHQCRFLRNRLAAQKTAAVNHVATNFRCACTLISTPSPMNSEIIAVPPYETSGNGTPTTGKSPLTMLMLTNA